MAEITTTGRTEDGDEVEVTLDTSEFGLMTPEEAKAQWEPKLRVERKRATRGLVDPDELLEDPDADFVRQLAERHGEALRDLLPEGEGEGKREGPDLEKLEKQWRSKHLDPLEEKVEGLQKKLTQSLRYRRDADIERAMSAVGVDDDGREPLAALLRERIEYDEEHDGWYVVDTDGEFRFSGEQKAGKAPYMTAAEWLSEQRQKGNFKALFPAKQKAGIGYEGPEGGGEGDLDTRIAQAEKDGKWNLAGRLKAEKLEGARKAS